MFELDQLELMLRMLRGPAPLDVVRSSALACIAIRITGYQRPLRCSDRAYASRAPLKCRYSNLKGSSEYDGT